MIIFNLNQKLIWLIFKILKNSDTMYSLVHFSFIKKKTHMKIYCLICWDLNESY